jgi:hypothetical protein
VYFVAMVPRVMASGPGMGGRSGGAVIRAARRMRVAPCFLLAIGYRKGEFVDLRIQCLDWSSGVF